MKTIECRICEFKCRIPPNSTGRCRMYFNDNGSLTERLRSSYLRFTPIIVSMETIPILHYKPNAMVLEVGSVGCNFRCKGCISDIITRGEPGELAEGMLRRVEAESIVGEALSSGCSGIVFSINEPIVKHYTILELAREARRARLSFGLSTNLYYTIDSLTQLKPYLDFVNVGLKGGSDSFYEKVTGGGRAEPVFRNMYILWRSSVHVEASIIYVRGYEREVYEAASRIASISPKIPLQVMRFLPVGDAGLELQPTPREAEDLCRRLSFILDHVYLFNTPATSFLNTIVNQTLYCVREFYGLMGCRTVYSRPDNYYRLTGYYPPQRFFEEEGFFGGFRVTRPVEMILSILYAIGVRDPSVTRGVLNKLLNRRFISRLHHVVDGVDSRLEDYFGIIEDVGLEANALEKARELISFMRRILDSISRARGGLGVRVYYSFGHPLYALAYPRMENKLVEAVGCTSVNRVVMEGKPGRTITPGLLEKLNPDIIFISGFMSYPEEYFYEVCRAYSVRVKALEEGRVYRVPPAWDFGSPKWILGLAYIASKVNPSVYSYDVYGIADEFYRRFYGLSFREGVRNLSFYKP